MRNEEKENDKAKGEEEVSIEEVTAEEILKKEQKKQRAEGRKRKREMKRLSAETESNNKKQKLEVEIEEDVGDMINYEIETEENDSGAEKREPVTAELNIENQDSERNYTPIVTRRDRLLAAINENEQILENIQVDRITLDKGGRHFATSRKTLLKAEGSILKLLVQDGKRHYCIDRGGAHFWYILNFLREDCNLAMAVLPRENMYLMELTNECTFYKLDGLKRLVEARLATYKDLGLAF